MDVMTVLQMAARQPLSLSQDCVVTDSTSADCSARPSFLCMIHFAEPALCFFFIDWILGDCVLLRGVFGKFFGGWGGGRMGWGWEWGVRRIILWTRATAAAHLAERDSLQASLRTSVVVVCWLLNVPTTCWCISGTDLRRPFYVLPH